MMAIGVSRITKPRTSLKHAYILVRVPYYQISQTTQQISARKSYDGFKFMNSKHDYASVLLTVILCSTQKENLWLHSDVKDPFWESIGTDWCLMDHS